MEEFRGGVCSYCGQGQQSHVAEKPLDLGRFRSSPVQQNGGLASQTPPAQPIEAAPTKKNEAPLPTARTAPSVSAQPICKLRTQTAARSKSKFGVFVFALFLYNWIMIVADVLRSFDEPLGHLNRGEEQWLQGVLLSFVFLVLLSMGKNLRRWIVILVFEVSAVLFILKPFVAPFKYSVQSAQGTEVFALSITSESHLYFLVTGIVLMVINGFLLMKQFKKLRLQKEAAANPNKTV